MPTLEKELTKLQDSLALYGESKSKSNKALAEVFDGWKNVDHREALMVGLPASGSAYFAAGRYGQHPSSFQGDRCHAQTTGCDSVRAKYLLPQDRAARYAVLQQMAFDPTIDCAVQMHIANALSAKADQTNSVYIDTVEEGKEDKIVTELRSLLTPIIDHDLYEWAHKAAIFGSCFTRVYGEQGVGITGVRSDYYTHPRFIQKFEKAGKLAGFTSSYQGANNFGRQIQLLPPWTFVGFEIPVWEDMSFIEPIQVTGIPVDLSNPKEGLEGLIESQEYGQSLIATAYEPWMCLKDALCSLLMSRRNAARLERLVGVSTGKLEPERAARYVDMIAERISNASAEVQTASWLDGNLQTVINHLFPILGEKGSVQVDAVQGTADISALEDVMFHVKRLGGALGIDPSLLGFGDFLSGGLGEGGFFRISIMASQKANFLRKAIKNGLDRLCEIHIAYKYGKVFTPEERPWAIKFNSISSAIEREEQETLEAKSNFVQGLIASLTTIDQEFSIIDKRELAKMIWQKMRLEEEDFERIFPEQKAKEAEEMAKAEAEAMLNSEPPIEPVENPGIGKTKLKTAQDNDEN